MTDGSSVVSEAIVSIKLAQQWEPRNINAAASFSKMRRVSVCMLFPNCQISHIGYFYLLMNVKPYVAIMLLMSSHVIVFIILFCSMQLLQ